MIELVAVVILPIIVVVVEVELISLIENEL